MISLRKTSVERGGTGNQLIEFSKLPQNKMVKEAKILLAINLAEKILIENIGPISKV